MKRKIVVIALAAIFLLSMFACAAKQQSVAIEPDMYYEPEDAASVNGFTGKSAYNESYAPTDSNYSDQNPDIGQPAGRKIIKTGSLEIEALEYEKCVEDVSALIKNSGGYVEYSKENKYRAGARYCSITARIPQENFDSFIEGAINVGNVTSKALNARDITESYVDTESRLNVLKDEKEALMGIMSQAETVEDLMYVQNRLYDVIEEIESYEARLRSYDSQINYSEIEITIKEVEKETPVEEETWGQEFKRRVKNSVENLWEALKGFGIGIVVVLPWLIIPAVIAIIVIAIVKSTVKRRRKKAAIATEAANAAIEIEKAAEVEKEEKKKE